MSNGFDFNHDGKVDMQDVHLYEDIFSDESGNSRQTYRRSSGGHISGGSIIGGILALSSGLFTQRHDRGQLVYVDSRHYKHCCTGKVSDVILTRRTQNSSKNSMIARENAATGINLVAA